MKKTLVSALTAALVVGAASTTFAAANPFSDVPSDSWAYDAVAQLAADGVIEGYGDGTFRGQQNITRYEMAQMVAKAMAKSNVSAADKALIDKLAAEFSDELNNLGVRVSNLERNADFVQWHGQARYTYNSERHDYNARTGKKDTKDNNDKLLLRLEPSAEVNEHWHVKARIDATTNMDSDSGSNDSDDLDLRRIWAQGDYKNFQVKLGKFGVFNAHDNALLFDDAMSGAEATFGKTKNGVNVKIAAGRINLNTSGHDGKYYKNFVDSKYRDADHNASMREDTANIQGIGVNYNLHKFDASAAYYHLNSDAFKASRDENGNVNSAYVKNYKYSNSGNEDNANVWEIAAGYRFDRNWKLAGAFANNTSADKYDNAWYTQVNYKGAQPANRGTWGAWAGYKQLGANVAFDANVDDVLYNSKGWFVGANYTPFHNTVVTARYFNGKDLYTDDDASQLWGRVQFFF